MKKTTFLAAMALSLALPAAASAQTTNTGSITYDASYPTPITGLYTNTATGQVTANGDAADIALTVGDFLNHGQVTADGTVTGSTGIRVNSGGSFTNTGTVTATHTGSGNAINILGGDFNNQGGTVTATATGTGTFNDDIIGILIAGNGGFENTGGAVQASATAAGIGILVDAGNFDNTGGTVNAQASGSESRGIDIVNGTFINTGGTVTATATSGSGISLGANYNFNNRNGMVTATAATANGYGINLADGNFDNSGGTARLFGGQGAIRLLTFNNQFIADGASTLVVGSGGGITFSTDGTLDFSAGSPKLVLLETAAQTGSATYTVARSSFGTITATDEFSLPSGPVFSCTPSFPVITAMF